MKFLRIADYKVSRKRKREVAEKCLEGLGALEKKNSSNGGAPDPSSVVKGRRRETTVHTQRTARVTERILKLVCVNSLPHFDLRRLCSRGQGKHRVRCSCDLLTE